MGGGVYDALVVVLDAADELVVGLEDGVNDGVIWIQIIILIQVIDMYVVTKFNLAGVREFDTKYYIDEGCFPGTVFSYQGDFFTLFDFEGDVFEEYFFSKRLI